MVFQTCLVGKGSRASHEKLNFPHRSDLSCVEENLSQSSFIENNAWRRQIEAVVERIKRQQSKLEIVARQIAAFDDLPVGLLEDHGEMIAKQYHYFNVKLNEYRTSVRRNRQLLLDLYKTTDVLYLKT